MSAIPSLSRCLLAVSFGVLGVGTATGQTRTSRGLGSRDSALVGRILLAEDRRDFASASFREGARHDEERIRELARRAAARVRDATFAARDSFPRLASPPIYAEPAWRLRYRALAAQRSDCASLGAALADSAWPVRLRAVDLVPVECAGDSTIMGTLRRWVAAAPTTGARRHGEASWHAAAHALVALARIAPETARALIDGSAASPVPWLRVYAARAAGLVGDSVTLRRLAGDANDNVTEAAIDALGRIAGHAADELYLAALSAHGYQAVRAGARALAGTPTGHRAVAALIAAARRLRRDSSETSRDARMAVLERLGELADSTDAGAIAELAADFDCVVARSAADLAMRLGAKRAARCAPLPVRLPSDAVSLALGREARLRVVLADSSGSGAFIVRLRGDVAPIMAARVLALARAGYYDGLTWHRVEPDFVIQGGGPGANEYVGYPRFVRDELGTVPHVRGTVGMSTRGHDSGDAQWFVNLRDNLRLNRDYTVFAEVIDGIDVVDGILEGDVISRIEVLRETAGSSRR